jgi:hypothetical protein
MENTTRDVRCFSTGRTNDTPTLFSLASNLLLFKVKKLKAQKLKMKKFSGDFRSAADCRPRPLSSFCTYGSNCRSQKKLFHKSIDRSIDRLSSILLFMKATVSTKF